jgi:predicted nuclease with RNAse H fold
VRALGVDVGVRKGLDLVVLDGRLRPRERYQRVDLSDLGSHLGELRPDVVAIDSPPGWARAGRSRSTERELRLFGIQSYGTPTEDRGIDHPFYEWMRIGFEVFRIAARSGYRRFAGGTPRNGAMEVFPHASAVVLAGCLPPRGVRKAAWRAGVLRDAGVRGLRSPDQVDAALAALTGLYALRGFRSTVGDPLEGVIVLPTRTLPSGPYTRCDPSRVLTATGREGPRREHLL